MKHKKLIITLVVVAALVAGAVAYAAFTSTASTDTYYLSTGTSGLDVSALTDTDNWLNDLMPAVTDNTMNDPEARHIEVAVLNAGEVDFGHVWLTDTLTSNPEDIGSVLHVEMTNFLGQDLGVWTVDQIMGTPVDLGPLAQGVEGDIWIAIWLDAGAGNQYQDISIDPGLTFNFEATQ